jgi:hypothetical protein
MIVMTIKAVVFDIGGVLEITPGLGVTETWESRCGLLGCGRLGCGRFGEILFMRITRPSCGR